MNIFSKRNYKRLADKLPILSMNYRKLRDALQTDMQMKMTPMGFKFSGNKSMCQGKFEVTETRILKSLFKEYDVVVNIGANIGYYCCQALQYKKKVFAFEPLAKNAQILLENIKANGWEDNIEFFPLALSNQSGVVEIYGGGTGASMLKGWAGTPEYYCTLVPCNTLDNVLGNRLKGRKSLFIIDIEGAEKFCLEGATGHFEIDPKPLWFVEITTNQHQPTGTRINPHIQETFQIFWSRGYNAWTVGEKPEMIPICNIAEVIERVKSSHNFIFLDKKINLFELLQ
jgi:FkbM family methyltransferase